MLIRTTNRRQFLHSGAGIAAAVAAMPGNFSKAGDSETQGQPKGDRPRIACIGAGVRGTHDSKWAAQFGDIVAICDVDLSQAEKAREVLGVTAELYQDYRHALDRQDVDVIINATPDHWHTAINIAACQAGKDVYAEKPLTLTIEEGKLLCRVVKETERVVQVGTQQRTYPHMQKAVELVRNGRIGRLKQVWVALPYFSTKGGPFPASPVPKTLDWDVYQGQTQEHAYCKARTHSSFRWWHEYSGGIITDWGNHHLDIAHWGMDCEQTGPISVEARGLFPNHKEPDCYNTADRFFSRMIYPNDVELLYFVALNDRGKYGEVDEHELTTDEQTEWLFGKEAPEEIKSYKRNGIMFIGDKGRLFVNRGDVFGKVVEELEDNPLPADAWRAPSNSDHMANFFECVKSRKEPASPVQIQHRTITACHLTNISLRLNRALRWNPEVQQITDDEEARSWQQREQRSPYLISS